MTKPYPPEKLEKVLNLAASGASSTVIRRQEHVGDLLIKDLAEGAAIELKGRELPEEKVREIYAVCRSIERPTITEVVRLTGVCKPTARKYMLKAGYKLLKGKPRISEERSALILGLYLGNPGCSIGDIAYASGENRNTVYKHLLDNGYRSYCIQGFQNKKRSLEDELKD